MPCGGLSWVVSHGSSVDLGAGYRTRGREARPPPPGAGGAFFGGAREPVLPENETDRGGVGRQRAAKQRLDELGLLAEALDQRRDVAGRLALEGKAVEPEAEIDAGLMGR